MHSKTKRLFRQILLHQIAKKFKRGLYCDRCGKAIRHNDYFMLHDYLWKEIAKKKGAHDEDVYCKRCSEHFLGRRLTKEDLNDAPINEYLEWN